MGLGLGLGGERWASGGGGQLKFAEGAERHEHFYPSNLKFTSLLVLLILLQLLQFSKEQCYIYRIRA